MEFKMFFILVIGVICQLGCSQKFPKNQYEYSVERDWILKEEIKYPANKLPLNQDEAIVNQYLSYLKTQEFYKTKPVVPPSRPIEDTLDEILESDLYKALKKLPKGGNMHIHENHVLSKRILLDIVFASEDFEHLWIVDVNNATIGKKAWRMDFFINPPKDEHYVKVKSSSYYTKERILSKQTLIDILSDEAKRYPTDSNMRWEEMSPLWDRGSSQLINNIKIKREYIKATLTESLKEGVQYIESRRSLKRGMYILDSNPIYNVTNGKRYLGDTGEEELNLAIGVVQNFTKDNPDFIGMKRIIHISRGSKTIQELKDILANVISFHRRYPKWIIGCDLVSEEDKGRSHLFFLESFLTLYDDKTKRKKIDLYMHTAETNFAMSQKMSQHPDDPVSALQNTYDAILLGAKRVGHGIAYMKHPFLMKLLRDRQIAVETCPVSNQILGYQADLRNHPVQSYLRYGIPVVMGSDDPGTFGYDHFTVDWYMTYFGWGLDLADLKLMARNSLKFSGMSTEEKKSAGKKFDSLWQKYIDSTKKQACETGFSGTPGFAKVLPLEGARSVSTRVYIYGSDFQIGICKSAKCKFGNKISTAQLVTPEMIICSSPPLGGSRRRRDTSDDNGVTVALKVSLDGTNYIDTSYNFTYRYDEYEHPTPKPKQTSAASILHSVWTTCNSIWLCFILICLKM